MIIVSINGGLGNQLFQYAFGKHLEHLHNEEVLFDLSAFDDPKHRPLALGHFNTTIKKANQNKLPFSKRKKFKNLKFGKSYLNRFFYPCQIIEQDQFDFNPLYLSNIQNAYYWGYWQSEQYFVGVKDNIRRELVFKEDFSPSDEHFRNKIAQNNSVSLHVRRGDYVGHSTHPTCELSYYQNAIETIASTTNNPCFFIFSDDISWCKEHLSITHSHSFISTGEDWRDLRLMTLCNHNIIANSSFSWWGAYLGTYEKKIVISPKRWFSDEEKYNTKDLRPINWLVI